MPSTTEQLDLSALILRPGDVVVLRNSQRSISAEEAAKIAHAFSSHGIGAIVVGPEWAIERDHSGPTVEATSSAVAQDPITKGD